MPDNRFKDFPIDNRFPGGGVDVRFQNFPTDGRFPEIGTDTRFMGDTYGGGAPPIITQTAAPTFGPYTAGDTPAGVYTAGTYASSAGTISSAVPSWTINGVSQPGSAVLVGGDVVGLSVLVTDSAANTRTFGYGTAAPAGAAVAAPLVTDVAYDDVLDELTFNVAGTEPMTMYYVSTASATPPSAATIIAAPDGTAPVAAGVNYLEQLTTNPNPGTWYLHFLVSNSGGNSATNTVSYVGAAFDPASLPNVEVFFDIGDMTTLFQDTAASNPVTAADQFIARVNNRGSLGGFCQNSGGTDRPQYKEVAGRKFFNTDGSNDYLELNRGAESAFTTSGGFYLWILAYDDGSVQDTGNRSFLSMAAAGAQEYNHASGLGALAKGFSNDLYALRLRAGLDNTPGIQDQLQDSRTTDLPWSIIEFETVPTAASPNAWLRMEQAGDGGSPVLIASMSTANPGFPDTMTNTKVMVLGANLTTGGTRFAFHKCSIAAVILASGTPTTIERDNIRAFLRARAAF